jgi:hypothetical protein
MKNCITEGSEFPKVSCEAYDQLKAFIDIHHVKLLLIQNQIEMVSIYSNGSADFQKSSVRDRLTTSPTEIRKV